MKVLTTAGEINSELIRLIKECASCRVAVAWASVGFEAFDLLMAKAQKIKQMIVGTHFYQTHPAFMEACLGNERVRFVLNPDGVFHPKVYLFEKPDGSWGCVVGSPNFTQGGLECNDEMAVLLTSDDPVADAFDKFTATIDGYWQRATAASRECMKAYREAWKRKQESQISLKGKFGKPGHEQGDGGKTTLDIGKCRMTWAEFFNRVKSEQDYPPHGNSMVGRLRVIRAVRELFASHLQFKDIELAGRQRIAGLVMAEGINFLWFGSMRGAGYFKQAVSTRAENLSHALDAIPDSGAVPREQYLEYMRRFDEVFPDGGGGLATATRLLAMKRPDTFVCLDSRNREGLCEEFGLRRNVGDEEYWDSFIKRIIDSTWWNAPAPASGDEKEVWEARAAFLDSLYYDGKDMPSS
jgi:HKD family nuclease